MKILTQISILSPVRSKSDRLLAAVAIALFAFLSQGIQAAPFVDVHSDNISALLPPPPRPGSDQYKADTGFLKDARSTSTLGQVNRGKTASHDSVFDYNETLGSWFNSRDLPKTTALFNQVNKETKEAIEVAKNSFARTRPSTWKETGDAEKSDGYSYPSGHTTRAFVWADLLSNAFPGEQKALHLQARQKAWYRVILGRHFPADVRAGKIYGKFLAAQFLKSPEFQKQWSEVTAELRNARQAATTHH